MPNSFRAWIPVGPRMLWLLLIVVIAATVDALLEMPLLAVAACLWPVRKIGTSLGIAGPALCGLAALIGLLIPWALGLDRTLLELVQYLAGGAIVFVFAHLSRRESRATERARLAAGTDTLTGLLNRKGFLERLVAEAQRSAHRGASMALAYLDCDTFKQFNDSFGHLAGDRFLMRAAASMKQAVRSYDSIGRLGGDEFAVIFPEADATEAEQFAIQLRDALAGAARNQPGEVRWTMGLAVFPAPRGAEEMLDQADKLMLAGKRSSPGGIRIQEFGGGLLSSAAPPIQR